MLLGDALTVTDMRFSQRLVFVFISFLLRRLSPLVLSLGFEGLTCEEVTFPDEGTL